MTAQYGYSTGHFHAIRGRAGRNRGVFSRVSYDRGRGISPARPIGSRNLTLVNKHNGSTSVTEGDHSVNNNNSNSDSNSTPILDKSLDASNIASNNTTTKVIFVVAINLFVRILVKSVV